MALKPFTCQYCLTVLKFGKLARRIYYSALIVGCLLGFTLGMDERIYGVNISWKYILLMVIIFGIIYGILFWKYGELEEVE